MRRRQTLRPQANPGAPIVDLRRLPAARPLLFGTLAAVALAGCAPAPKGGGVNDPYEAQNRAVHRFNVDLDKTLLKPSANAYGSAVPAPLRQGVSNVASNLSEPSYFVNDLLQGNLAAGVQNLFRFVLNTTAGVGGLFDPSTAIGLAPRPNDFGRTLHVWGARQGAYLEVPILGPSTERDLTGTIVDFAINPLRFALNGNERKAALLAEAGAKLETRFRFSSTIDSILYGSADSYAQERLLYLQNRDYALGIKSKTNQEFLDPYEDPYGN
ncbi:hypothetical protein U879_05265 [Defluviimonas sp. 20V17]|uniref:Phospholipid-binding lipoprotein MlaA n=1 Tax=Allgaiera indica TaxID=765699 RepID=A0AAN4ZXW5_9RHOB|nr:VacJ family lipoprotein [Allgaiera indica]KDB04739.1 hypothetical protein U879_05265 [Defluviimonas sp. 20V17]GHD99120.1 hypothetical protein GCM10008024_05370 [Allgaiera indica]SDW00322.1 phospholipid-binding lipoprotein MlaA [Allgaiera indica]